MSALGNVVPTKSHSKKEKGPDVIDVKSFLPKRRQSILKWNGWGYQDSKFAINHENMQTKFTGNRYPICNDELPNLRPWIESVFGFDLEEYHNGPKTQYPTFLENIEAKDAPDQIINEKALENFKELGIDYSLAFDDRLFRSHGQTLREIFQLRIGEVKRIPDIVLWPRSHDDVVKIVQLSVAHEVVIIPFGGGTSVSCGVECPENEHRMIVSLDTSQMNKILWLNKTNNTALIEAGIIGQDLDRELAKFGFCCGHEPDSYEFSTLGGWVATRSSGMKKNIYGNIEDMIIHVKMVTTKGVVQRNCQVPRISGGPDIHHLIFGSEGILGVITEVIMKVHPLPFYEKYGSIVFPAFELGVQFLHEVTRQKLKPASIRLMDNGQFTIGQAMKLGKPSFLSTIAEGAKKYFLTQIKGFNIKKISAVTLLMQGTKKEVEDLERRIFDIASKYSGISGGELNGKRGYMLTFTIAYLRDAALDFGILSESFETSVPWDKVTDLCRNVKSRIECEVKKHGIFLPSFVSCRVTQSYEAGACVYFYFAFSWIGVPDPVTKYEQIEMAARDEVLASGGSISHHHGVGKLRKHWMKQTVSEVGMDMLRAVKLSLDPLNIFASGNILDEINFKSSL